MPLTAHGFFFGIKAFIICERNREAALGILGSFPLVVGFDPVIKIVGIAAVETVIAASDDICIVFLRIVFHVLIIVQIDFCWE